MITSSSRSGRSRRFPVGEIFKVQQLYRRTYESLQSRLSKRNVLLPIAESQSRQILKVVNHWNTDSVEAPLLQTSSLYLHLESLENVSIYLALLEALKLYAFHITLTPSHTTRFSPKQSDLESCETQFSM
jgi:hypothetical protein